MALHARIRVRDAQYEADRLVLGDRVAQGLDVERKSMHSWMRQGTVRRRGHAATVNQQHGITVLYGRF